MLQARMDSGSPLRGIFTRLGDSWSARLIVALGRGACGFNKLQRRVTHSCAQQSISQRMLSLTLRSLVSDGLVEKRQAGSGRWAEYSLTETGGELFELISEMDKWVRTRASRTRAASMSSNDNPPPACVDETEQRTAKRGMAE